MLEEYTDILDVWAPGAIIGGTVYANQETNALASTVTPTPPASWLNAVDTLITTLKNASIWQTLDLFYCFAAPSANACTYNWVNTSVGTLTANGTINYGANQYAAGDGTTGWFSSSFSVNSGKASNGNSAFGYFCLNEDTTDAVSVFNTTGGKSSINMQGDSTGATIPNVSVSLNTSTSASFSSQWGSTVGHWVLQQNNATAQLQLFIDGSSVGTSTQTGAADSGTVQMFKNSAGAFTSRQTAFVHYGSTLTATQQLTLSKALYTFLTAMVVRPLAATSLPTTTGPSNVAPYKHCSTGNGNNLYMPVTPALGSGEFQGRAGAYPYAMIKVGDPNYVSLHRMEIHSGDYAPFDITRVSRSQFNTESSQSIPWQTTVDLSFSFYIESGTVFADDSNDLLDFHDTYSGVNCGPTHGIVVSGDGATVGNFFVWGFWNEADYINNYNITQSAPCALGQWHHVRTTWRLDNYPNGFCYSWLDGVQVMNFDGTNNNPNHYGFGNPNGAPFWQQVSLYFANNATPGPGPAAVWYANVELDSSGSQPYSSRISNPLPVPPLS